MITPTPPPCDSPKVWMRKTWPKVEDMGRTVGGEGRPPRAVSGCGRVGQIGRGAFSVAKVAGFQIGVAA